MQEPKSNPNRPPQTFKNGNIKTRHTLLARGSHLSQLLTILNSKKDFVLHCLPQVFESCDGRCTVDFSSENDSVKELRPMDECGSRLCNSALF